MTLVGVSGHGQTFYYVEAGLASCPVPPTPTTAVPKTVSRGVAVPGRIDVRCGFEQGSYTVTLNSTDPGATFSPKTFLVNFGHVVGNGIFAVTFSTVGIHSISTTITSNMGSPAANGHFVSPANEFNIVTMLRQRPDAACGWNPLAGKLHRSVIATCERLLSPSMTFPEALEKVSFLTTPQARTASTATT
ncbi:hypothetical protein [Roseateles sp.]|uniref:hypothetical protein n=1 Tax=Roseateles sp. TaxID=1971397 RepID=UPI00286CC382|nr:hypothetical protein [Roseateles sp.]